MLRGDQTPKQGRQGSADAGKEPKQIPKKAAGGRERERKAEAAPPSLPSLLLLLLPGWLLLLLHVGGASPPAVERRFRPVPGGGDGRAWLASSFTGQEGLASRFLAGSPRESIFDHFRLGGFSDPSPCEGPAASGTESPPPPPLGTWALREGAGTGSLRTGASCVPHPVASAPYPDDVGTLYAPVVRDFFC